MAFAKSRFNSVKLPVVSAKELERALFKAGYIFSRQKGSHRVYDCAGKPQIVVPLHGNADIKPGLLLAILKRAGIPRNKVR